MPEQTQISQTTRNGVVAVAGGNKKVNGFFINDHVDILVEVLRHLDGQSLSAAACVCRLWSAVAGDDSVWEHLCFRHISSPASTFDSIRPVVSALGGYRRLYVVCVRPVLSRLAVTGRHNAPVLWNPCDQLQLSLSLFCVDYYERLCAGDAAAPSLKFLYQPVNVV